MLRILLFSMFIAFWGPATSSSASDSDSLKRLSVDEKSFLKAHPALTVLVNSQLPPYTFVEEGEVKGYWIDLLDLMFKDLPVELHFQTRNKKVDFGQTLGLRKADILTSILEQPYRKDKMLFSSPVISFGLPAIITNSSSVPLNNISDLSDKKVAGMKGHPFEKALIQMNKSVIMVEAQSLQNALEMVSYGHADATLQDISIAKYFIDKLHFTNLRQTGVAELSGSSSENACFAIAKDRPVFQTLLNDLLNSIKQEEIIKLREKWGVFDIRDGVTITSLTISEKNWIQELRTKSGEVPFCVDPDWMPIEMIDSEGHHKGMVSDMLSDITTKFGIPMNLVPTNSWGQSLEYVRNGECSFLATAAQTFSKLNYLEFTTSYLKFPLVVAVRDEELFVDDLSKINNPLGVIENHANIQLIKNKYPDLRIVKVDSVMDGLEQVRNQKIYGFIDILPVISYHLRRYNIEDVKIGGKADLSLNLSIAVRKGENPELLSILNKALYSFSNEKKTLIMDKWLSMYIERITDYSMLWRIIIIGVLILSLILFYLRQIQKHNIIIQAKNRELELMSKTDKLTQLLNRNGIDDSLHREYNRYKRNKSPFAIIILDIDHFKQVNDTYGHQVGDDVLSTFGNILKQYVRKIDIVGRWGGEEFLIISPDSNERAIIELAERLRVTLNSFPFPVVGTKSASFGIAVIRKTDSIDSLINRADKNLYNAKKQGRNRIVFS